MDRNRITPDNIQELAPNEIFVFGSTCKFGAIEGLGVGPQGQCYAIPTMQGPVESIKPYVDHFVRYAKLNGNQVFLVTKIGCGIAGFTVEEIAPLFAEATKLSNIKLPREFWEVLEK